MNKPQKTLKDLYMKETKKRFLLNLKLDEVKTLLCIMKKDKLFHSCGGEDIHELNKTTAQYKLYKLLK